MIRIYKTIDHTIHPLTELQDGCLVHVTAPTSDELQFLIQSCGLSPSHLEDALDLQECPHWITEEDYMQGVFLFPVQNEANYHKPLFSTIPLSIFLTTNYIITVCKCEVELLNRFFNGDIESFSTRNQLLFFLQIMYLVTFQYQRDLILIHHRYQIAEKQLHISQKNQELIDLLELEKSLVYFTTSLQANEVVFNEIQYKDFMMQNPEYEHFLLDIQKENQQARQMTTLNSSILNGTMDAYASVISNNLSIHMKFLTLLTLVLSIPTMIASFAGMNVKGIPFHDQPYGFWYILTAAMMICFVCIFYLLRKKRF